VLTLLNSETRLARWGTIAASVLAGAALWEFGARGANPAIAVPLSETLDRLVEMIVSGELERSIGSSLALFATGLAAAIVLAVPLGLMLARLRWLRTAFSDYILLLYAMPTVALIPFIMSMFGLDFSAKAIVVFLFAFFPMLYNTIEGARSIRPELIEVARSFRSSETAIWFDVLVPATLPYMMTGFRQAIGRALVGMVAAEFFLAASGIGELIMMSSRNFDTAALFGTTLVITILGVALMRVGTALEERFTVWRGLGR
jgi:ABC-type nitrate/sulfonate/bicarbonate transport system permease component